MCLITNFRPITNCLIISQINDKITNNQILNQLKANLRPKLKLKTKKKKGKSRQWHVPSLQPLD